MKQLGDSGGGGRGSIPRGQSEASPTCSHPPRLCALPAPPSLADVRASPPTASSSTGLQVGSTRTALPCNLAHCCARTLHFVCSPGQHFIVRHTHRCRRRARRPPVVSSAGCPRPPHRPHRQGHGACKDGPGPDAVGPVNDARWVCRPAAGLCLRRMAAPIAPPPHSRPSPCPTPPPPTASVFFTFLKILEGHPEQAVATIQARLWPTLLANFAVWPIAHLYCFSCVPGEYRILFNNVVAIGWSAYLSLTCGGGGAAGGAARVAGLAGSTGSGDAAPPAAALALSSCGKAGGGGPGVAEAARQVAALEQVLGAWGAHVSCMGVHGGGGGESGLTSHECCWLPLPRRWRRSQI